MTSLGSDARHFHLHEYAPSIEAAHDYARLHGQLEHPIYSNAHFSNHIRCGTCTAIVTYISMGTVTTGAFAAPSLYGPLHLASRDYRYFGISIYVQ